jgi:peptidoglycan/xylan/chitin deacetylase (PgdA/CDA1 family)
MRKALRSLIAAALYYSGFLWLYAAYKLRGKAVVLMYHRVLPRDSDTFSHAGIVVTPETFEMHMQFIARHFRILDMAGFRGELSGQRFSKRACLVTFDDGWQDNHCHALPTLAKHRVPATIFLATEYIGSDKTFWQERLTRLLFRATRIAGLGDDVLAGLDGAHARALDDGAARGWARDKVTYWKRRGELDTVERVLRELERQCAARGEATALGEDRFMSWDEVHELRATGLVAIGSHTHSHTILPAIGYDGAKAEFEKSLEVLRERGLPRPRECAYPNGIVDDAVARAAADAGFDVGFATRNQLVAHGDDRLRLRRINIHEQATRTAPELLCLITGVL